ncbi:PREDICTED: DNA-binding protein HEXBP [Tarenaya hassleriana]|uniref:DNA-binding protein HEXBP n=1 Tax=Tarenaya hassleriana TaxID=28532 RepID=UPI00053C64E0|nr:PREDICTED: DNA-binding protein HEXBP [Tarenaya hassleriana]
MVSQRQRLARKRFKEAHPEMFPKPEPTPPKDPEKKKKKKSMFKRKKSGPIDGSSKGTVRRGMKRHPLRIPGMKPGEGCYICKGNDHMAKLCPQKSEWEKNKVCLRCRRRGHSLKNCPDKSDESSDKKLCYNCGESSHSLSQCPYPMEDGGTKFASCFICKERGHLSKNCPQNKHGIYPKGGCCNICGSVTHLVKDCPDKDNRSSIQAKDTDYEEIPRGKVTKLTSGDDLEDDFVMGDTKSNNKNKSSEAKTGASDQSRSDANPRKRQGPKVVNFVG